MKKGSIQRARTCLIESRQRGYDRLFSCFSSQCASILGDAWMVHHEWRQRGSINVQKAATIPSGSSVSRWAVPSPRFLEPVSIADRRASFPSRGSPRSVWRCWCWGGRGGASPDLCIEKNNKCTRAGLQACVTPTWRAIGQRSQQRKWCRLPHRPILTRIHRLARVIIFVPTPPDSGCSCQSWFMIGRLFGIVSQRVPSLFHRVTLMMKPQVVFVLGGPGAGKGTQCSKIVEVR